ncbi:hypothetical protein TNCV_4130111 [Trichonephila clavipes]|nr:hypothetical protein TNCV_4130111 [Trichonephila clavipes]
MALYRSPLDCNVVAFIVFEEGFHQPIKRTKQSLDVNCRPLKFSLHPGRVEKEFQHGVKGVPGDDQKTRPRNILRVHVCIGNKNPEGFLTRQNGRQNDHKKPPKWWNQVANLVAVMTPTWLYRQDFTKFLLNHHYNVRDGDCL